MDADYFAVGISSDLRYLVPEVRGRQSIPQIIQLANESYDGSEELLTGPWDFSVWKAPERGKIHIHWDVWWKRSSKMTSKFREDAGEENPMEVRECPKVEQGNG